MKELKRDQSMYLLKYTRQCFLNLMGRNNIDDPLNMVGEALNEEENSYCLASVYLEPGVQAYRRLLLTLYGCHVKCAEQVLERGLEEWVKAHVASPNHTWNAMFNGISFYAAARKTGKSKFLRGAKHYRRKLRKWLDMGNPNVKHYVTFLDAEAEAFKGNSAKAIAGYKSVVVQAGRAGHLQDAAFAAERLGEYYLEVMKDQEEASFQFTRSIKYWKSWGALGKVRWLQNKYSHLFTQPTEIAITGSSLALEM